MERESLIKRQWGHVEVLKRWANNSHMIARRYPDSQTAQITAKENQQAYEAALAEYRKMILE